MDLLTDANDRNLGRGNAENIAGELESKDRDESEGERKESLTEGLVVLNRNVRRDEGADGIGPRHNGDKDESEEDVRDRGSVGLRSGEASAVLEILKIRHVISL